MNILKEIYDLKIAHAVEPSNIVECLLEDFELKLIKYSDDHDKLTADNAALVEALDHTNQVLYNTMKLWNNQEINQNNSLDYQLCSENQELIKQAKRDV